MKKVRNIWNNPWIDVMFLLLILWNLCVAAWDHNVVWTWLMLFATLLVIDNFRQHLKKWRPQITTLTVGSTTGILRGMVLECDGEWFSVEGVASPTVLLVKKLKKRPVSRGGYFHPEGCTRHE